MAISDEYKSNLETLTMAAKNGDICLMECTDLKTGNTVIVVCAVNVKDKQYEFIPLAKMFDGNPYEEVAPPMECSES